MLVSCSLWALPGNPSLRGQQDSWQVELGIPAAPKETKALVLKLFMTVLEIITSFQFHFCFQKLSLDAYAVLDVVCLRGNAIKLMNMQAELGNIKRQYKRRLN